MSINIIQSKELHTVCMSSLKKQKKQTNTKPLLPPTHQNVNTSIAFCFSVELLPVHPFLSGIDWNPEKQEQW